MSEQINERRRRILGTGLAGAALVGTGLSELARAQPAGAATMGEIRQMA